MSKINEIDHKTIFFIVAEALLREELLNKKLQEGVDFEPLGGWHDFDECTLYARTLSAEMYITIRYSEKNKLLDTQSIASRLYNTPPIKIKSEVVNNLISDTFLGQTPTLKDRHGNPIRMPSNR
jgi:hypothetical protein